MAITYILPIFTISKNLKNSKIMKAPYTKLERLVAKRDSGNLTELEMTEVKNQIKAEARSRNFEANYYAY